MSKPNISKPGRLKCAAIHCEAIAIPTEVATPWPSGPVVVSTPDVQRYSGWPGHFESSWRNRSRSSRRRSEEHTSELQSLAYLVCRLLLEKKKQRHRDDPNDLHWQ